MRSRLLLNLVLLLIVVILVVLVIRTQSPDEQTAPARLTELLPEQVNRIELHRNNNQTVILSKDQGTWRMKSPYSLVANDYRVEALLGLLQAEYHSRHDLTGRDPALYGLDKPLASITFNDSLTIDFGSTDPLSHRRYVRINGQLYLLTDTHYYHTVSPATGYLSHALLPAGKITGLHLPNLNLELVDGQWRMQPVRDDVSADRLTELVDNWRAAQALRLEPYSGPLPSANIRVRLDNHPQPLLFTRQQKDGQTTLLRHDARMRYVINDDSRKQLLQLPEPAAEPELETLK